MLTRVSQGVRGAGESVKVKCVYVSRRRLRRRETQTLDQIQAALRVTRPGCNRRSRRG